VKQRVACKGISQATRQAGVSGTMKFSAGIGVPDSRFFLGDAGVATSQVETFMTTGEKTAFKVLATISLCHFVNDMLASVLPATYPMLKESFRLNFTQIGLITLT
jgi:hypothetical protein